MKAKTTLPIWRNDFVNSKKQRQNDMFFLTQRNNLTKRIHSEQLFKPVLGKLRILKFPFHSLANNLYLYTSKKMNIKNI